MINRATSIKWLGIGFVVFSSVFILGLSSSDTINPHTALLLPDAAVYADYASVDIEQETVVITPNHVSFALATTNKYAAEHKCMSQNIYFEARNQTVNGQIAIGLVTLNRVAHKKWPNTVCTVVKQHKQFSWYSDGKSDRPRNKKAYTQAQLIASTIMSNNSAIVDFTKGATHYHADYVNPYWNRKLVKIATIGTHIFYRGW